MSQDVYGFTPTSVPIEIDPARASIARVYDAALGGKDNYAIDRDVLRHVASAVPEVNDLAVSHHSFLTRALRFCAGQGRITQFLDCGSSLPAAENTHRIVQRIDPHNRVVYVDNDPVALAYGRVFLEENDNTHILDADIFNPAEVLTSATVRAHIDITEPVALLHVGTLHHYLRDDGADMMKDYIDAIPSGSFVVIAHFFDTETPGLSEVAHTMQDLFLGGPLGSGRFRTRAQIMAFVAGLDIVPPNPNKIGELDLCDNWWPDGPQLTPLNQVQRCIAAVVGRKP
ncbi:MAG: hypothetical protein JWQ81_6677 [Amycolatopsis sp.]|uniref:SAM-dependent methyltransferase n=1 Tax=Amycolatopsis sp. TaxID=37632 RepID=UPI00262D4256|nr:SAM-dependent methyltransferase [Amycolatopsis sp.]MCU1685938.1 hypothetical protein [Amycolatopsis sp.]